MTLFGSHGTSAANSSSSGSANMSSPRVARFREDSHLGSTTDEQVPRSTCCGRVFSDHTSHLRNDTNVSSCESLFERKRFQARFLVFQAKTRGRRASQGVVDSTTVHHQSSSNLSRFRLPVLQIQLSKQNFFQTQAYVDSIIIAVCGCLSLCCR